MRGKLGKFKDVSKFHFGDLNKEKIMSCLKKWNWITGIEIKSEVRILTWKIDSLH